MLALKLQGARGAARLVGAVVAASGVLLVVSGSPHRLAWALVGGCCAGIAFAARTEPLVTPFTDPVTLNRMLRRMLTVVLAGAAGLALLPALGAAGAPRAIIAVVLLGATGLCVVGLAATAMLLALPLRAIVAEAPAPRPRGSRECSRSPTSSPRGWPAWRSCSRRPARAATIGRHA
ncbi:MAG: hypothetical protein WKF94_18020 [Solirubrobacteraceae bacterium]